MRILQNNGTQPSLQKDLAASWEGGHCVCSPQVVIPEDSDDASSLKGDKAEDPLTLASRRLGCISSKFSNRQNKNFMKGDGCWSLPSNIFSASFWTEKCSAFVNYTFLQKSKGNFD